MPALHEYLAALRLTLEQYAAANFVLSVTLSVEERPGDQVYLVGRVVFTDASELHFREYLDGDGTTTNKVMYSYHYQTGEGLLILRYDNTKHRGRSEPDDHKHIGENEVSTATAPALRDVLLEIVARSGWGRS